MARRERVEFRATSEERQHLRVLAARTGRSESDLIRTLLDQVDVAKVDSGLSVALRLEASATERAAPVLA